MSSSNNTAKYPGLLGLCNIILLISSTSLIFLGAALTNFYLLDKFDFISPYFYVVPYIMICLGVASFVTALYGCYVAVKESRPHLILYSVLMVVIFCTQMVGIFAAMELRSEIFKSEFSGVDLLADLQDYKGSPATRAKWDALHREFHCCGGLNFNNGYEIWRNSDLGLSSNSVPDSCCQRQTVGCGRSIFTKQAVHITNTIYTHGCVTISEEKLRNQVIPILLGYAGVGTCLALLQLLSIVFACSYSASISRRNNRLTDESMYAGTSSSLSPPSPTTRFGQDNMSSVFVHENSLMRQKRMRYPDEHDEMDEREV